MLVTSGCSTPIKPIEITAKPVERPVLTLPQVDQIRSRDVEWIIITPENYQQVFEDLKKKNVDVVLIGLTDQGYEALSKNIGDIQVLVRQQQAIIAAYEKYYNESNQALDAANQQIEGANQAVDQANQNAEPKSGFLDKLKIF